MNSILKRYTFKSGLDIIVPLKCGTRWLEGLDVDNCNHTTFRVPDARKYIHSGTTFIWRPVREHFLSAVKTELSIATNKTILDVITDIEGGLCSHWCSYLYKELYPIWEETGFQFYKLRALSELNPSAAELKWTSTMYEFPLPSQWESVEKALSSLSPKHTIRIERLISEEEKWLKSMIKSQYSKKDWEAYSNLEDSRLEILSKGMDLKQEVELINQELNNQLKLQKIQNSELMNELKKLRNLNFKLESRIEYLESILDKKLIKSVL
jgi:hypothetical protein